MLIRIVGIKLNSFRFGMWVQKCNVEAVGDAAECGG